jgi:hypothetical protein
MPSIVDPNVSDLERAFQLARSGRYASLEEIRKRLRSEGYSDKQIIGKGLTKQLLALIHAARRGHSDKRDETSHAPSE